jgi:hypothetical protein
VSACRMTLIGADWICVKGGENQMPLTDASRPENVSLTCSRTAPGGSWMYARAGTTPSCCCIGSC